MSTDYLLSIIQKYLIANSNKRLIVHSIYLFKTYTKLKINYKRNLLAIIFYVLSKFLCIMYMATMLE